MSSDPLHVTTPEERRRAFMVLFACMLAIGMGQTLVYAVMPPIARSLGMSELQTTLIYSLSSLLWVATSAFWGRRSDRVGRKPILLLGLFGFGLSTMLVAIVTLMGLAGWLAVATVFPLLLLSRGFFGAFGSGVNPAATAYVADRTTREERASGIAAIGAAFGIGTVVGPGVAAGFAEIHILAPFFAISAFAFVTTYFIWRFLPERTAPISTLNERRKPRSTLKWRDRRVLPWVLVAIVVSVSQSILLQLMPFYVMDTLHIDGDAATQMVSVGLMAMAMATLFAQVGVIQRFDLSVQFLLRWGSVATAAGMSLFAIGGSYGLIASSLALCGFGFGLLRPGITVAASLSVSPKDQGAVAGFIGSTAAVGVIINPVVGIPLYEWHTHAPFVFDLLLVLGILAFAVLHPSVRDMRQSADKIDDEEDGIGIT
jgi:MFS family permease